MYLYFGIWICVLFEPGGKDISRRPFTALRTDLCSRDLMFGSLGLDWAPSVLEIDFDVQRKLCGDLLDVQRKLTIMKRDD